MGSLREKIEMTEGYTWRFSIDTEAVRKETEHLFRLMRKRKIEETHFEGMMAKMIKSHLYYESSSQSSLAGKD